MKVYRKWAMPNSNTFSIKPIMDFIELFYNEDFLSVDPFANTSKLAKKTNDLNPDYNTDFSMDAIDFLKMFESESVDFVFYDPPYSLRQVSECYKGVGIEVTQETTSAAWNAKHKSEIRRILKPNGKVLCFGWNSNGIGGSEMELLSVLIVAHGGQHNDTICTAERKIQGALF